MNAIVCFATPNYIDQMKYLIGAIRGVGAWMGDLVTILINDKEDSTESRELNKKGCIVIHRSIDEHPFFGKYFIYDEFFKRYNQVLYLDCDFLILKPLQGLFARYKKEDMYWDKTPFDLDTGMTRSWLEQNGYDPTKKMFQAAGILFKPKNIVTSGTARVLIELGRRLKPVNIHVNAGGSSDEPIQNIFWNKYTKPENEFKDRHLCFVGCRNQNTILAHTTNYHAPWNSVEYKGNYDKAMRKYNSL